jgi:hypothetical protein
MTVHCVGTARIQHKQTGKVYEVQSEQLDWIEDGMGEGSMGAKSRHQAIFDHDELGTLTWTLWEYPVGTENDRDDPDVGEHTIIKDFQYHLKHEPEDRNSV